MGERSAAAYIGMPVSVLQSLRWTGHFETKYMARTRKAFHELDLNAFVTKLLTLPRTDSLSDEAVGITLAGAMRLKLGSADRKAGIIRAMIAGELSIIGAITDKPTGLLLDKNEVRNYMESH